MVAAPVLSRLRIRGSYVTSAGRGGPTSLQASAAVLPGGLYLRMWISSVRRRIARRDAPARRSIKISLYFFRRLGYNVATQG
jgi:hypothetical protein